MPRDCPNQSVHRHGAGFTLVELMIGLAVVAVLAAIAAPGMTALINANQLNGASGEVTATLQLARAEAVRRNARVTVCASTDGTTCTSSTSWTRWIVRGRDNVAAVDDVIRDNLASGTVQVSGPAAGIVFKPSGMIDAQTTVTVCKPVTNPTQNQRVITVMISGTLTNTYQSGSGSCP